MTRPAYVTCCRLMLGMLVVLSPSTVLAQTSPALQEAQLTILRKQVTAHPF